MLCKLRGEVAWELFFHISRLSKALDRGFLFVWIVAYCSLKSKSYPDGAGQSLDGCGLSLYTWSICGLFLKSESYTEELNKVLMDVDCPFISEGYVDCSFVPKGSVGCSFIAEGSMDCSFTPEGSVDCSFTPEVSVDCPYIPEDCP
jgi:hypothetical protein